LVVSHKYRRRRPLVLLQGNININITITITITNVSPTTTATGGTPFSTCPPPNQRGATPHYDRNPAVAGQYHAPPTAREQSGGCKTSSFQ